MKCYAIENHPNDSRVKIDPQGIVQCLSSRMGTGGNNMPFVLIGDKMLYWTRQSHSEFICGAVASNLKNRDYKDFTDIVQMGAEDHDLLDLPGHFPISEGGAQQQFNGKRLQRWKRSYTGGRNGRSGQEICAETADTYRMSALTGVA